MSAQTFMPSVPRPPHDPTWLLLDARVGWSDAELDDVEQSAAEGGALALEPEPGSLRALTEPSGSFGGLKLPSNVARAAEGGLFLLDAAGPQLKRFDECACEWRAVPCFGGRGAGPRQLAAPHGIGICGGNLFVCDTGNHRLSVYALRGYVLRAHWVPPAAANLTNPWEPYAVAFDGQGRVYVSDGANGCVHRFTPYGLWETCLSGFGVVTHLAVDCRDRLYAVVEGEEGVRVFDAGGQSLGRVTRVDAIAEHFPRLQFRVDSGGNLHLAALCGGCPEGGAVFDTRGNPTAGADGRAGPRYFKRGTYVTRELDSRIYQCQWHRVVVRGRLPSGTRLRLSTHAAETPLSAEQVAALPPDAWETNLTARRFEGGEWDVLVAGGVGRYLWLRVEFESNGAATPVVESVRVEFPRISLRRYLPAVFGEDPNGANFTDRFLSIFDATFRGLEKVVDEQARLFDPLSAPAERGPGGGPDFLTWLASWLGLALNRQWPEQKRRRLLKRAACYYHIRGTREGLRSLLLFSLDMEAAPGGCCGPAHGPACHARPRNCAPADEAPCAWEPPPLILEHFQLRRWLFVGAGRLGEQAVLWGKRIVGRSQLGENAQVGGTRLASTPDPQRDPFHVYAHKFSVFVPASRGRTESERKSLENLLNAERPAHTAYQLVYVEPRFRVGVQSVIGFDSVVGRYPAGGVTLGEAALGRASVLGGAAADGGAAPLAVGKQTRVGAGMKLD